MQHSQALSTCLQCHESAGTHWQPSGAWSQWDRRYLPALVIKTIFLKSIWKFTKINAIIAKQKFAALCENYKKFMRSLASDILLQHLFHVIGFWRAWVTKLLERQCTFCLSNASHGTANMLKNPKKLTETATFLLVTHRRHIHADVSRFCILIVLNCFI